MEPVETPWGSYAVCFKGRRFAVKILRILPKHRTSLHFHRERSEKWLVLEGDLQVETGFTRPLDVGDSAEIGIGTEHRLGSLTGCVVLELMAGEYREDDVVRIQDDFGRPVRGY